jgi:hypothetical protein
VENAIKHPLPNRSRHYNLFFATKKELKKELATLSAAELEEVASELARVRKKLISRGEKYLWEFGARGELDIGADMAAWAVRRARLAKAGQSTRALWGELPELVERFVHAWANRAREGGMRDSAVRMAEVGKQL